MFKKLTLLSVARALAIMVLEQPGGPNISTPLGGVIPILANASGCLKGHSMDCFNFNFNSFCPPISDHLTVGTSTRTSFMAEGFVTVKA